MTKFERQRFEYFCAETQKANPGWAEDRVSRYGFDLWMRWKILTDLYFFGSEVMGWKESHSGRRKRLDPKLHRWLARILEKGKSCLILIPRLHLKSTWVKLRIIQRILQNPNIRIILASSTSTLGRDQMKDIVRMIQNPVIMRLFPTIVPSAGKRYANWEKCTEDELTIRRDPSLGHVPQEPQLRIVGTDSNITGIHADEAYPDDIVTDKTVTTVEQMQKTITWWAYFQSIMELDAPIIMTGTFYHDADLYHKIWRERHFGDDVYIRRAIENGKPIYSSWFSLKDLEKLKKRQGSYIFNRQYMLDPNPAEERMFPQPYPVYQSLPPGKYRRFIAVDPAATTKAWSDESGIAIGYVNETNHLYIEEAMGVKLDGGKLVDLIIQKFISHQAEGVGIELGLQEHLIPLMQMKIAEWETRTGKPLGMNVVKVPLSRKKSKADRINLSLGAAMREGKVHLNDRCKDLMLEMEFFTGRDGDKDNLVDAASMLFMVCPAFSQHYWLEPQFRRSEWTLDSVFKKPASTWEGRFAS